MGQYNDQMGLYNGKMGLYNGQMGLYTYVSTYGQMDQAEAKLKLSVVLSCSPGTEVIGIR